eukprot:5932273-Amphidinium_carterae.1
MDTKRMRKQRDPLTLRQVVALETLIMGLDNAVEVCILGHLLFLLHSTARWSDVIAMVGEPTVDDVLVQAESKHIKNLRGMKRLRIPI